MKKDENNEKLSKQMKKELSPAKSVIRIIVAFFAILIWILIGVNITVIFSSAIQQFIGFTSIFIRHPIVFLLIAIFNIVIGLFVYFLIGILWWGAIHVIWSIRWFYGYIKYRGIKKDIQ